MAPCMIFIIFGLQSDPFPVMKSKFFLLAGLLFVAQEVFAQAPGWTWANKTGGSGTDYVQAAAADVAGNVYVGGSFYSTTVTFGSTTLVNTGLTDLFLVKYDVTGNVLWAKGWGQPGSDWVTSVTTDASGHVYLTGHFNSTSITFGAFTLVTTGAYDMFIVKLDGAGNVLWAHSAGGSQVDFGYSVSTDLSGNVFVAGSFSSPYVLFGATTLPNMGGSDIYLVKYGPAGNILWARCAGESAEDGAYVVAADGAGNVYITGSFGSSSIIFGSVTLNNTAFCVDEIFITKYDGAGNTLWAKVAVGTGTDIALGLAADASGNVFITGYSFSVTLAFGAITLSNPGSSSAIFIACYDPGGNPVWATKPGLGIGTAIATDACGDVYATGYYGTSPITFGSTTLANSGSYDIYAAKYDASGNVLWAQGAGGTNYDVPYSISASPVTGDVYVAGYFMSTALTFGSSTLSNADVDGFVAHIQSTCTPDPLPVELLNFSGETGDGCIVLEWSTASEINNNYFSIERSVPESDFKIIGQIAGAGNSAELKKYSFTDRDPLRGVNYYRLRQTDYDGSSSFSKTIAITYHPGHPSFLTASPVPTADIIRISPAGNYQIEVLNINSETVMKVNAHDKINISSLQAGMYLMIISDGHSRMTKKIIKH